MPPETGQSAARTGSFMATGIDGAVRATLTVTGLQRLLPVVQKSQLSGVTTKAGVQYLQEQLLNLKVCGVRAG